MTTSDIGGPSVWLKGPNYKGPNYQPLFHGQQGGIFPRICGAQAKIVGENRRSHPAEKTRHTWALSTGEADRRFGYPLPLPPVMYGGPPRLFWVGVAHQHAPPLEPPVLIHGQLRHHDQFHEQQEGISRASAGHKRKSLVKIGEVTPPTRRGGPPTPPPKAGPAGWTGIEDCLCSR